MLRWAVCALGALIVGASASHAGAITSSSSGAVCQPDQNHADFDFGTNGQITNISGGSRAVICHVPMSSQLEGNANINLRFANGAQGTSCTLRHTTVDGGSTLASNSGTWSGGLSALNLVVSSSTSIAKTTHVRCALVAGGGLTSVQTNSF
jgi:hypothetical protein